MNKANVTPEAVGTQEVRPDNDPLSKSGTVGNGRRASVPAKLERWKTAGTAQQIDSEAAAAAAAAAADTAPQKEAGGLTGRRHSVTIIQNRAAAAAAATVAATTAAVGPTGSSSLRPSLQQRRASLQGPTAQATAHHWFDQSEVDAALAAKMGAANDERTRVMK